MLVRQAYRYELKPNRVQQTLLTKHAGVARFAYNWGLAKRLTRYQTNTGKSRYTNAIGQHRVLNRLKKTEFPWMYEVSKCAPQEALRDLDRAFQNFLRGRKNRDKIGFPQFKKKGKCRDSFRLTGTVRLVPDKKKIQLPRLGKLRLKEYPRLQGRILSATVRRETDRWFVSLTVERERPEPVCLSGDSLGVDVGLTTLVTFSDGTKIPNPRPLQQKLRKLRRLSKAVSRKHQGSKNRQKAVLRLSKLHWRIKNLRQDTLHKVTTSLAKNHSQIVIEDLHIKGLQQNRHLARTISDVGWGEFRRQLTYKTQWYGSKLVIAPRFYPSSKKCSNPVCNHVKTELSLSDRVYHCEKCGLELDRDLNAARNLVHLIYDGSVAGSSPETLNACGEMVSPSSGGSLREAGSLSQMVRYR